MIQQIRRKNISTDDITYNLDTPKHTDINVTNMLYSIMPKSTPVDESVRVGVIGSGNVTLDTNPRAYADDDALVYARKKKKSRSKTKRRNK